MKHNTAREEFFAAKPSELLRLALKDLEDVEATPGYAIDMGGWLWNSTNNKNEPVCYVCLAGACLVKRFAADRAWINNLLTSDDPIDGKIRTRMLALDCLRIGYVDLCLQYLGLEMKAGMPDRFPVTAYCHDPELAKEDMAELADYLEGQGY